MVSSKLIEDPQFIADTAGIGRMVRARRRAHQMRIDDTASLIGVSSDLLSRLENGKRSVRLDKLLMVLDSMGLAMVIGPKDHPTMHLLSPDTVSKAP